MKQRVTAGKSQGVSNVSEPSRVTCGRVSSATLQSYSLPRKHQAPLVSPGFICKIKSHD